MRFLSVNNTIEGIPHLEDKAHKLVPLQIRGISPLESNERLRNFFSCNRFLRLHLLSCSQDIFRRSDPVFRHSILLLRSRIPRRKSSTYIRPLPFWRDQSYRAGMDHKPDPWRNHSRLLLGSTDRWHSRKESTRWHRDGSVYNRVCTDRRSVDVLQCIPPQPDISRLNRKVFGSLQDLCHFLSYLISKSLRITHQLLSSILKSFYFILLRSSIETISTWRTLSTNWSFFGIVTDSLGETRPKRSTVVGQRGARSSISSCTMGTWSTLESL